MQRHAFLRSVCVTAPLLACAPRVLRDLPVDRQRDLGESAVAQVCSYELEVESDITRDQRYQLSLARQYLDDVVAGQVVAGGLSCFFTRETLSLCAADLEWGGVNFDVQRLVDSYGADAEIAAQQRQECAQIAQAGGRSIWCADHPDGGYEHPSTF